MFLSTVTEMEGVVHANISSPATQSYLKPCTGISLLLYCRNYLFFDMFRLVNSDSQAFIKRFQPEISSQVSPVLKNYVSM